MNQLSIRVFTPKLGCGYVTGDDQRRVGLLKLFSGVRPTLYNAVILLDGLRKIGLLLEPMKIPLYFLGSAAARKISSGSSFNILPDWLHMLHVGPDRTQSLVLHQSASVGSSMFAY